MPVGSHGLLTVLDWLAPTDEPWRRGAFVGLDARHGAAHLHRSVLEGIAMTMQRHTAAMSRRARHRAWGGSWRPGAARGRS